MRFTSEEINELCSAVHNYGLDLEERGEMTHARAQSLGNLLGRLWCERIRRQKRRVAA